jgi:hypothetical protein
MENDGAKIVEDLLIRVIGLLTQEIKFFVSAIRNKVEKSDGQDDNKKEHTKLSKASELMSSVNHKTILRTMKMLE